MFNLDNIDLDFDDDFSSNIFSKRVDSAERNAAEGNEICSRSGVIKSLNPPAGSQASLERKQSVSGASRENKLKRPHAQVEMPQKKRVSQEGLLQRKFPGPAGLLPDKPFRDVTDLPMLTEKSLGEEEESVEKEKPVIYSQCSGSVFLESSYQKLVTEFNLRDSKNPLNRYTVEWVKKKAFNKGLQGRKIPFLGLVVHMINHSMPDPVLVLRDPTGEINGSLHREVWAEMGGKLRSGIALALRQVGVLITGVIRRQIYLNITMNNILAIYTPSESETEVEITTVNKVSKSELFKSFPEWLAPSRTDLSHPPPPHSPFTTLDSPRFHNSRVQPKPQGSNSSQVLTDWGILLDDTDFTEEMQVPQKPSEPPTTCITSPLNTSTTQPLSPAESFIFQEVLSGIDFDEFQIISSAEELKRSFEIDVFVVDGRN